MNCKEDIEDSGIELAILALASGNRGGGTAATTATTFTLGGTVSGLGTDKTLVLTNDGVDKSITANGEYTFDAAVNSGSTYNVTVKTQPTDQSCTVSNGTGTASANVSNINVSCADLTPALKTGAGAIGGYTLNANEDGSTQLGVARSYTDNSNGTVTDNATGMVWQKCSRGQENDGTCSGTATTASWAVAGTYCSELELAGESNWRLPSRQELETLVDYGKTTQPRIDTTVFPATVSDRYWSATTNALNTSNAWSARFSTGLIISVGKTSTFSVRCVSGASKVYTSNFTDNGNGTVKDNATGLVWQKCSQGLSGSNCETGTATTPTWGDALTECSMLGLASRTWRLPNINELKSLVDTTKESTPTIDTTAFPETFDGNYSSSTTLTSNTTFIYAAVFNTGATNNAVKTNDTAQRVRCVSGPD
ncbi:MAG: DUF1566 domain-containing protein [Leptospira sp.]|nr:DUF1566 domain-containing protein [Leptospira sp.]